MTNTEDDVNDDALKGKEYWYILNNYNSLIIKFIIFNDQ